MTTNKVIRGFGYTGVVDEITWIQGNNVEISAYLWGGGGGGGGNDSAAGGYGSGGGFSQVDFTVNEGDVIRLAVGGPGGAGASGAAGYGGGQPGGSYSILPIFNTRTTPTSPATYPQFNSVYCPFLNTNGVWENPSSAASFDRSWTVNFPVSGSYTCTLCADNLASLSIDGTTVCFADSFEIPFEQAVTVAAGDHTIRIQAENTGGPGAVALTIVGGGGTDSYGAGRGGNAGDGGSSGAGGGGGGATVLLLNDVVIAVAGGGGGGGGGGNGPVGENAPGTRGQADASIKAGQNGINKNGDGGGAGGGGGGYGGGNGGESPGGDTGGGAGSYGGSWSSNGYSNFASGRDPAGSGQPYYSSARGQGGTNTRSGTAGYATLEFNLTGVYVHNGSEYVPVQETFVNGNGLWKSVKAIYTNVNGVWQVVVGAFAPIITATANLFGTNPREASGDAGQSGGGGGGCCVISTALADRGIWSQKDKFDLIEWCEKYLHGTWWGETFRRGYQVLGSQVVIPVLLKKDRSLLSKYANWAFTNGCNLVRGKKFNLLSLPNSIIWIIGFMAVGAVVSKSYATKCWVSLYKDKE